MKDRIEQIVDRFCEGKKKVFAEKCGVTPQTCSIWFNKGFNTEAVNRIRLAFPEVNIRWVETGEGCIDTAAPDTIREDNTSEELAELRNRITELEAQLSEKKSQINALLNTIAKYYEP